MKIASCYLLSLSVWTAQVFAADPVVLYERHLTDEHRGRFELVSTVLPVDTRLDLDQMRVKYGPEQRWTLNRRAVKAQLIFPGANASVPSGLEVIELGRDLKRETEEAHWVKSAASHLVVTQAIQGFKLRETTTRFAGVQLIYLDGIDRVGWVQQIFEAPTGERLIGNVFEVPNVEITPQEFLCRIIERRLKVSPLTKTSGAMVSSPEGVAWISGRNLAIYLDGSSPHLRELTELYAGKFPSSLQGNINLDKTDWARTEINRTLPRVERALRESTPQVEDWFAFHMWRVRVRARIPLFDFTDLQDPDPEKRALLFHLAASWWKQFGAQTYWDERLHQLVWRDSAPAPSKERLD